MTSLPVRAGAGAGLLQALLRRVPAWHGLGQRACRTVGQGLLSLLLLLSLPAPAQTLVPIPPQTARVVDMARLLTDAQRLALEAQLADYEKAKGTQIAVLTIPSTAPEVIEQFGIRLAEAWKTGRKGVSDGAILIVAPDNPRELRRLRIEVGYGLEGAIPDLLAARIINEDIAPRFREKDYFGGLSAALNHMRMVLEKEALPPPAQEQAVFEGGWPVYAVLLFMLFFVVGALRQARRFSYLSNSSRGARGALGGLVAGGLLDQILANSRNARRGGWGSSHGGGGFGGGGFGGGGGGGFGGGGASGDW